MDRTERNGESAHSCDEAIDAIDQVIDSAREAADELLFVARTQGRYGRTALWFAEDFRLELDWRLEPRLERLKRALRKNGSRPAQGIAG